MNSSYVPNINIPTTPALSADEVIAIAQNDTLAHPLRRPNGIIQKPPLFVTRPTPILGIYVPADNVPVLAYRFTMNVTEGGLHTSYLINANSGEIISAYDPALYDGYVTGSGRVFDPNPVNTPNRTDLTDTDSLAGAALVE
ncbi:MAG: hypothetical protein PHE55_07005 [Methylococcaceae bacterium]|nr:hypothetical protein [Methylococcaceae bacterium]